MMRRWMVAVALIGAAGSARAEPPRWRLGVAGGLNRSSLGGSDPVASGGGLGFLLGGRASFIALPWLSIAADLVYVRRHIAFDDGIYQDFRSELDIGRFELPAAVRLHMPTGRMTGFALAGAGLALGASASHPVSDEGGDPDVDIANTDLFLDAGLGATWDPGGLVAWTVDARYRHGLRTIDPESPGLDIRVHSLLLEVAVEWRLR